MKPTLYLLFLACTLPLHATKTWICPTRKKQTVSTPKEIPIFSLTEAIIKQPLLMPGTLLKSTQTGKETYRVISDQNKVVKRTGKKNHVQRTLVVEDQEAGRLDKGAWRHDIHITYSYSKLKNEARKDQLIDHNPVTQRTGRFYATRSTTQCSFIALTAAFLGWLES